MDQSKGVPVFLYITFMVAIIAPSTAENIYYILPNNSTPCPSNQQLCHNISYIVQHPQLYARPSVTMYFLSGTHTLDQEGFFEINRYGLIRNLSWVGSELSVPSAIGIISSEPSSQVQCTQKTALQISNVINLLVSNITFTNCGNYRYVLEFGCFLFIYSNVQDAANISIDHTVIQSTSGYAMIILLRTLHQKVVISDSAFINNTGEVEYNGGNVRINLRAPRGVEGCSLLETLLIVESSVFAYGDTAFPRISGTGLFIILDDWPCVNTEVLINNVRSLYNTGRGYAKPAGGNLAILVSETGGSSQHHTLPSHNKLIIKITNSVFMGGLAIEGGGALFYVSGGSTCPYSHSSWTRIFQVSNSTFISNTAIRRGGGLYIKLDTLCHVQTVRLTNVTFANNKIIDTSLKSSHELVGDIITGVGGNLAIYRLSTIRFHSADPHHEIKLENCTFYTGIAITGGGIYIYLLSGIEVTRYQNHSAAVPDDAVSNNVIEIVNSHFADNIGFFGGAICIIATGVEDTSTQVSTTNAIRIENSSLQHNTGYSGSAVYILANDILPYALINYFVFENVSFQNNHHIEVDYITLVNGLAIGTILIDIKASVTVALQGVQNATFRSCDFQDNNATGILAIQSNIFFQGDLLFKNNSGKNGGALSLFGSFMFPKPHTTIRFLQNHALRAGGAIHVEREHSPLFSIYCFLQPDVDVLQYNSMAEANIQLVFENNTAEYAGSTLYGGDIDQCLMIRSSPETNQSRYVYLTNIPGYSTQEFNYIFQFNDTGVSAISSDPIGVCICVQDEPVCDKKLLHDEIYPGSTYELSAVVVGQREGVVPGIIRAAFSEDRPPYSHSLEEHPPYSHSLEDLQDSQAAGRICTKLKYTIFATNSVENLTLTVDQTVSFSPFLDLFIPPTLLFAMLDCPPGFNLSQPLPKCDCVQPLDQLNITCSITEKKIYRPAGVWIGYYFHNSNSSSEEDGILVHNHCPFDYCKQELVALDLTYPDEQCAFNHSGVLCGGCTSGLSLALGTSQCKKCSNGYLALLSAFAAAGFGLVLLLTLCNLTVSEGAINGLIFYANILHINRAIFFPQGDRSFLTIFISWLNLDLGIEVCFYDGMDAYAKTWLQLVFPAYIWLTVLLIIVSSHYSTRATKLLSRNAVKVLATLFPLSFNKIQRMIIAVLSFTFLTYPHEERKTLWLYDANIEYLTGKHIPLFLAALLTLLFLSVPYTLLLLFIQCLQFKSGYRISSWMSKWKPLFDAYTGPYKDRYTFWTGLLLLVRSALFLVFIFNISGNPDLNLMVVGVSCYSLLLIIWAFGGVYKSHAMNILESSFYVNLGAASLVTLYARHTRSNQAAVAYTSSGVAFITFIGILGYYASKRVLHSQNWKDIVLCLRCKRKETFPITNHELVDLVPGLSDTEGEGEHVQPQQARVRLRLTFDENREPILVDDESD